MHTAQHKENTKKDPQQVHTNAICCAYTFALS